MRLHLIAATVVTAALLSTGTIAASAATIAPTPSPVAGDCQFGQRLEAAWKFLPAELRTDLRTLKELPAGAERAEEARGIRDRALAGDYGPRAQSRAAQAQERRIRIVAGFPAELRADLDELKATAPGERQQLAKEIADTALAGGYGAQAQYFVERVQSSDAWQNCVADRQTGN